MNMISQILSHQTNVLSSRILIPGTGIRNKITNQSLELQSKSCNFHINLFKNPEFTNRSKEYNAKEILITADNLVLDYTLSTLKQLNLLYSSIIINIYINKQICINLMIFQIK